MNVQEIKNTIEKRLTILYGKDQASRITGEILDLCNKYSRGSVAEPVRTLDENDVLLITYGDSIQSSESSSLNTLREFLREYTGSSISIVHLLPFFPYTSDDGFSVKDYRQVNRDLGDWNDIANLKRDYKLAFDAVLNHVSQSSIYMQEQCRGNPEYQDFLITLDPATDTSMVTRPRNLPLLNEFETSQGKKWFWTTFSRDQVDFNFKNPRVLLEMLDILLFYVKSGAFMIRLDAVPFMWKELGTTCSHLSQNHEIVKLIRNVYDLVYPNTLLLSETNVPHNENIAYFGDGHDEAQLIYNFSLPPLILHAIHSGNAEKLTGWARQINKVSDSTTFLNITATHDGIGMRPTEGILSEEERASLVELARNHGGQVGEKQNPDGSTSPYELNVTYYDAVNNPGNPEDEEFEIRKFMLSQAIPMSFIGIPGIYIHSLLGTRNYHAGVEQTGMARSINREKISFSELRNTLETPGSRSGKILNQFNRLLEIRRGQKPFHPGAEQQVLNLGVKIFALTRTHVNGESILALHNVSDTAQKVSLPAEFLKARDLLSSVNITGPEFRLEPYSFSWLLSGKDY